MLLKAVAFDWGHTVVDENRDARLRGVGALLRTATHIIG